MAFIVAEHFLKDGEPQRAIESYRQCIQILRDIPKSDARLTDKAQSRLYELLHSEKIEP
jgi:hypothetical protein